ncbi:MAG: cobyric acid synthase [Bacteroidota bacterium]|nr:cobyric acid synthase [Bacteroidota bacterium]
MKKKLRPIMFVGTGSDVGKSIINAAFCRIFKQDGYKPAPFKGQNMSLNSYATPDNLEIGRAQAMQAEACGIECAVEMNPVLLKPTSYNSSQVVLNGKPVGNKSASEYFLDTDRDKLFSEAFKSYTKLYSKYSPIVIEGAGSISEVNLWDKDISNMRVAVEANAATYLIADIDRGGVFGSVFGTIELLPENQRNLIEGIIINKFRGDIKLFEEGKRILEKLTKKPVVGVIPYFRDIYLEQEDSVVIDHKTSTSQSGKINVCVILLPHLSNFTDFDSLERIPEVHLFYSKSPDEIEKADIVILPGSKSTISDFGFLNETKISKTIIQMHRQGKQIYGICSGFQMMGKKIYDPDNIEGDVKEIEGLGIIPVTTSISKVKKTEQLNFSFLNESQPCSGYEIHMGITRADNNNPLCNINGLDDGYFLNERTWGTYIHGIFDNSVVMEYILKQVRPEIEVKQNFFEFKNKEYDRLASHVKKSVNMDYIYQSLNRSV